MKENLKKIIEHYGINNQQRKLMEEIFELQEAIFEYEYSGWDFSNEDEMEKHYREHIEEEFADVMVLLEQFEIFYNLDNFRVIEIMESKIDRQLERIEKENN